jgi:hypothetical protein
MDARMARMFAAPPADARWWRRPMTVWHGIAAAALIGVACYALGRYQAVTVDDSTVAKETVVYIIQEGNVPGTRNAFDATAVTPGNEWWRQTAQPQPKGGAI